MKVITDAGATIAIGDTEAAPTIGIVDYSRRVTDDFGVTTIVERGFSRTMSIKAAVPFDQVSALQLQLAELRAEPATWVADDRFASLVVRGFFKDLQFDLASPPISYCTLTVEGLASAEPLPDDALDPAPGGQLSTLQVLRPVEVTDVMLSYSSVAEDDALEWAVGATYPAGARVMLSAGHRVYESLIPLNTGKNPVDSVGAWLDVGPTNRWAMFDQALGTVTSADRPVQVTVAAGEVNAVALIDIKADTVRVQSGGYDRTAPAASGTVTFLDLPGGTAPVTITISGDAGVEIGTLLIGQLAALGITEASPTAAITDFSRKQIDDFGEVTIVKRAFAKNMSARALIDTAAVDVVAARLANIRARPCLWIGQDGVAALTIYGFFKEFSVEVGETLSKLSLSIEGMSAAAKLKPLGSLVEWPDVADPVGTKPADNADVTGDNVAKDTNAVGGRTATALLSDVYVNAASTLAQALRQDDLAAITDARTFVEGQPVSTYVQAFRNEQTTENSAINSKFDLLGAKSRDGSGWVLNLDTVQTGDGRTLSQRFTEIGANNADLSVNVQQLMEAVINPDGSGYSRFLLRADTNGVIAGIAGASDGQTGNLTFAANAFYFVDPNGGNPINLLSYDSAKGRWLFTVDVAVQKVVDGVVTTKSLGAGAATNLNALSAPADVAITAAETTMLEWTGLVIGDGVDAKAIALIDFTQDGSTTVDTAAIFRAYVDAGSGYQLVKTRRQGIRGKSGDVQWMLSQCFSVPLMGAGTIKLKITCQGTSLGGGPTSGSWARDIQAIVFAGYR